jgi:YVTN family beta-propeller protein
MLLNRGRIISGVLILMHLFSIPFFQMAIFLTMTHFSQPRVEQMVIQPAGHDTALVVPRFRLDATIPTGVMPKGVEITPDGRFAFTTDFGVGTFHLTKIDCESRSRLKYLTGGEGRPVEIVYSADSRFAYVTNFDKHIVVKIDLKTERAVKAIPVQVNPKILNFTPDKKYLYVSNWSSNSVSVIDALRDSVVHTIKVGRNPRGFAFTPNGRFCYVCNFDTKSNSVSVIDCDSRMVVKEIRGLKSNPRHVAVTPDGRHAYASLYGSGKVVVIETDNHEVIKTISCGGHPKTVAISKDGRFVYVANYGANRFDTISTTTNEVVTSAAAGKEPSGLDVTDDGKYIYVSNWLSRNVMIFEVD